MTGLCVPRELLAHPENEGGRIWLSVYSRGAREEGGVLSIMLAPRCGLAGWLTLSFCVFQGGLGGW